MKYREKSVEKTVVGLWDVHLDHKVEASKSYSVVKHFILSVQPTHIILAGDFCSMESLSRWASNKRSGRMEGRRYKQDLLYTEFEIGDLQALSPGSEIIYMEGNHEHWLPQYVEMHPELEGTLSFPDDLKLAEKGIAWVPENDVLSIGKMNYIHGWYHNEFYCKKTLLTMGDNVMCGHKHNPQKYSHRLRAHRRPYACIGVGCLCDLNPHYLRNKPNMWQHGFGFVEYRKSGEFQPHDIAIIDGKITFGGYTWRT